MNIITTKGKGWQKRCWDLAKAGEAFEVLSLEQKHVLFLQELCVAYDCKFKYLPGKVVLRFPRVHKVGEEAAYKFNSPGNGQRKSSRRHMQAAGRHH